jgi:sigma-E factor negative regulatory protein RseA
MTGDGEHMKSKISAMMDGELSDAELGDSLQALRTEAEALETWRRYHLISDALRDTQVLSSGFSERFAARLEQEPAILSPMAAPRAAEPGRYRHALAIAAGVAGVALVGAIAYTQFPEGIQIAQAPSRAPAAQPEVARVALPREANDYLLAHQSYSPRNSLQGVAPYVRTVSDTSRSR